MHGTVLQSARCCSAAFPPLRIYVCMCIYVNVHINLCKYMKACKHMQMRSERVEGLILARAESIQFLWWVTPHHPCRPWEAGLGPWRPLRGHQLEANIPCSAWLPDRVATCCSKNVSLHLYISAVTRAGYWVEMSSEVNIGQHWLILSSHNLTLLKRFLSCQNLFVTLMVGLAISYTNTKNISSWCNSKELNQCPILPVLV